MNSDFISAYFKTQRKAAILAILFTGICISASVFFFFFNVKFFYKGMAWPLLIAGLFIVIPELGVLFSAATDKKRVLAVFDSSFVNGISANEIPAVKQRIRLFGIIRWFEFISQLAGLVIILVNEDPEYWKGFGAGLFMMASFALVYHFFAERRAKNYLEGLSQH